MYIASFYNTFQTLCTYQMVCVCMAQNMATIQDSSDHPRALLLCFSPLCCQLLYGTCRDGTYFQLPEPLRTEASSSRSLLSSPASAPALLSACTRPRRSGGSRHPRPGVRVASSSDSWRAATDTRVPPSVEPITVGRAGICRHIESQGQAARAPRCSRALSRAGCLLAFAASLRSRRSSGGSGTAFLLCAPDAPCG